MQMADGSLIAREKGTPQGGVVSPVLANLFLLYVLDMWMRRKYPHIPFERYADDGICHCRSEEQAKMLLAALEKRFAECRPPANHKHSTAKNGWEAFCRRPMF
jgi:retron-type reverse transcriptase